MLIEIHDVDHGACVVVTGPTGRRLMLDCGRSRARSWSPSVAYRGERIDTLMLLNLDEDHVEDMAGVWGHCPIGSVVTNPTIPGTALRRMKAEHGMGPGVRAALGVLESFGPGFVGDWANDLGGVQWHAFWNVYGRDFTDTNNLSLAVFVTYAGTTILFGGDLECAGWRQLLTLPAFRNRLAEVKVLVASHHGRENGQCPELFDHMRPEVVIFSDGPKQYQTQETACWYAQRVSGIPDLSRSEGLLGYPRRRVMTTRRDGAMQIDVAPDGRFTVFSEPAASVFDDLARLLASQPAPSATTPGLMRFGIG